MGTHHYAMHHGCAEVQAAQALCLDAFSCTQAVWQATMPQRALAQMPRSFTCFTYTCSGHARRTARLNTTRPANINADPSSAKKGMYCQPSLQQIVYQRACAGLCLSRRPAASVFTSAVQCRKVSDKIHEQPFTRHQELTAQYHSAVPTPPGGAAEPCVHAQVTPGAELHAQRAMYATSPWP